MLNLLEVVGFKTLHRSYNFNEYSALIRLEYEEVVYIKFVDLPLNFPVKAKSPIIWSLRLVDILELLRLYTKAPHLRKAFLYLFP